MRVSLILLLVYLSVGMLGYALVEVYVRWKEHEQEKCTVANTARE